MPSQPSLPGPELQALGRGWGHEGLGTAELLWLGTVVSTSRWPEAAECFALLAGSGRPSSKCVCSMADQGSDPSSLSWRKTGVL